MAKPTNPNITIPAAFATSGAKTDFPAERITSGFDDIAPEILSGDNLNKFIDDTYKGLTYAMAGVTDLYKSAIQYDPAETYGINSLVFNIDNNGNTTFYRSVINNNVGYPLTNTNYWVQVQLGADILNIVMPIGKPQLSLDNSLPSNCIWLEGATVSRTTYINLFNLWGTTYGAGDGSTTFGLPDARNRALWGASNFGYLNAGLPDIYGYLGDVVSSTSSGANGAFNWWNTGAVTSGLNNTTQPLMASDFLASRSNPIYGASNTVQPPAIKFRIYTRYQ